MYLPLCLRPIIALLSLALAVPAVAEAQRNKLNDILDRYVESMGGRTRLNAIRSISISGTMTNADREAELWIMKKRPKMVRTTIIVPPGIRIVNAYDGTTAWTQTIGPNINRIEKLEVSPYSAFVRDAGLESPLAADGFDKDLIDYRGTTRIEGNIECHHLVVTYPNGTFVEHFIDTDTYYERKTVKHEFVEGKFLVNTAFPSDFRFVNGVVFSYRIVLEDNKGDRTVVQIDKIRINPGILDSIFAMPDKAEAPSES